MKLDFPIPDAPQTITLNTYLFWLIGN